MKQDESQAPAIAKAIYQNRSVIITTTDLAETVRGALGWGSDADSAKEVNKVIQRTFQTFADCSQ